jgi:D-alanyl-D-alanine dipeptidase
MEGAGFRKLNTEWWHFTLNDEPYPTTYFDFEVEDCEMSSTEYDE